MSSSSSSSGMGLAFSVTGSGSGSGEAGLFLGDFDLVAAMPLLVGVGFGVEEGFWVKKLEMVGCLRFKDGDGAEDGGED